MKNLSKLFSHFRAFHAKIHTQFHVFVQIQRSDMLKNMFQNSFSYSCFNMTSLIRPPMLILLLRMEWLRGRINTSLKLPELFYFKCRCPSIYGPILFPPLVFLLTACLPQSGTLYITSFFQINLCFSLSLGYLDVRVLFWMFVHMRLNSILSH